MHFLESIRFESGQFHLLELHQARLDRTFVAFYPGAVPHQLTTLLPSFVADGKHKFRFLYDDSTFTIESAPYQARTITSVKLVTADHLDYGFKFADRSEINSLVQAAGTDEIIMVKDGLITDASYANIACFDGATWWTPEQPLLAGVKRADLINKRKLTTRAIRPDELPTFKQICLINAMLDLGDVTIQI